MTYTATCRDCDLDRISSRLADILQVKWSVASLVFTAFDHQHPGIDTDCYRDRPVRVHLVILVMETLELQLQIRSGKHMERSS